MQRNASLQRNALIDLNVLPKELRPYSHPAWYVAGMAAALAGLVLLAPVILIQRAAVQETEHLAGELAAITTELQAVGIDVGQARGLRMQLDQTEASLAALRSERQTVLGVGRPLSGGVSLLYAAAPPGLSVDSVVRAASGVKVSGQAPDAASVISYARALSQGDAFSDVTITALTESAAGQGAALAFSIQAIW